MSRKFFVITSILILLAIFATACQSGDTSGEPAEGDMPSGYGALVSAIKERGKVVCGSRTDLAGFGELDADGRNVGFDIDFCRAMLQPVTNPSWLLYARDLPIQMIM